MRLAGNATVLRSRSERAPVPGQLQYQLARAVQRGVVLTQRQVVMVQCDFGCNFEGSFQVRSGY
eukprot:332550-Rhodomonas_salina.1